MRKNWSRDQIKRPYKTPSPSSFHNLQSPRPNFKPLITRYEISKAAQNITEERQKKIEKWSQNEGNQIKKDQKKMYNNGSNIDNYYRQQKQKIQYSNDLPHKTSIDSYNEYFNKASEVYSTIIKNNIIPSTPSTNKIIRGTGFKTEGEEYQKSSKKISFAQLAGSNNSSQRIKNADLVRERTPNLDPQREISKFIQQIIQLKSNYKELQNYCETINSSLSLTQKENDANKIQVISLRKKLQQKKLRQSALHQEVTKLKSQLEISNSDLANSNFQIYKMKQDLYQLNLQIEKYQNKGDQRGRAKEVDKSKQKKDLSKENRNSSNINMVEPSRSVLLKCEKCKDLEKTIININNALENKMFELSKRDKVIQNLLSELQKLQNEVKNLQKPKAALRKLSAIVDQVNDLVVGAKISQMNLKFKKMKQKEH